MSSKLLNLKKSLTKKNINTTLSSPDNWLSFGNMSLNFIATGSFTRGIPNRRMTMMYGLSGSGKSLIMGHIAKNAQLAGYHVIYIDTEDAIDPKYLIRIGVDIEDADKFLPVRLSTIEELAEVTADIFSTFDKTDKLAVFVDSLGMLETDAHSEDFEKDGKLSNDMGLFAKKLKKYLKNITAKVGERDCFFVVNQHAYMNQNVTDGRGTVVPSGGEAQIFIPSITLNLSKLQLKDEGAVVGIKLTAKTAKTRFNQLGMQTQLMVPYSSGIDEYDGVLVLMEKYFPSVVSKSGAWYNYTNDEGDVVKFQSKNFPDHAPYLLAKVDKSEIVEIPEEMPTEEDEE